MSADVGVLELDWEVTSRFKRTLTQEQVDDLTRSLHLPVGDIGQLIAALGDDTNDRAQEHLAELARSDYYFDDAGAWVRDARSIEGPAS